PENGACKTKKPFSSMLVSAPSAVTWMPARPAKAAVTGESTRTRRASIVDRERRNDATLRFDTLPDRVELTVGDGVAVGITFELTVGDAVAVGFALEPPVELELPAPPPPPQASRAVRAEENTRA